MILLKRFKTKLVSILPEFSLRIILFNNLWEMNRENNSISESLLTPHNEGTKQKILILPSPRYATQFKKN